MKQFDEWHKELTERLAQEHRERMELWEYMRSPEYIEKIQKQVLDATHEDIRPPWED